MEELETKKKEERKAIESKLRVNESKISALEKTISSLPTTVTAPVNTQQSSSQTNMQSTQATPDIAAPSVSNGASAEPVLAQTATVQIH